MTEPPLIIRSPTVGVAPLKIVPPEIVIVFPSIETVPPTTTIGPVV